MLRKEQSLLFEQAAVASWGERRTPDINKNMIC